MNVLHVSDHGGYFSVPPASSGRLRKAVVVPVALLLAVVLSVLIVSIDNSKTSHISLKTVVSSVTANPVPVRTSRVAREKGGQARPARPSAVGSHRMGPVQHELEHSAAMDSASPEMVSIVQETSSNPSLDSYMPYIPFALQDSWFALAATVSLVVAGILAWRARTLQSRYAMMAVGPMPSPYSTFGQSQSKPAPRSSVIMHGAKDLHFNVNGEALKGMQAGVDKLATVVGLTLGPKGRNVVLESKYGSPRIVNDGVTVAREVELTDPLEDTGAKLVRQAAQVTNDTAGDGTTTATILAAAIIAEGMKIVQAGTNPVQLTRGIEKTTKYLVKRLQELSTPVKDEDLSNVGTVSAGGNREIGELISEAMMKVGRAGVVSMGESRTAETNLYVVEGMQFERGYISPYTVTDPEKMIAEYEPCKVLLVDKKISTAREIVGILEECIRGNHGILIIAEDIEQEAMATLVINKLRGNLKAVAIKAPGFGERKTSYLEDIAVLTGATVIRDEVGLTLDRAGFEELGDAAKITVTKESTCIVGDGTKADEIASRVKQIQRMKEAASEDYEKDKLGERIARLSGGVAIIEVGAQTETELKEKKLRVEDALNATQAAVQEGIVIGGGCTLIKLAAFVDDFKKESLADQEQIMGADILKKALMYPIRMVAQNAGLNGNVVMNRVISENDPNFGYNAETNVYEDLMAGGIIDPTKVIRCAMENASSVARTFLLADVVVTNKPEPEGKSGEDEMGGY